MTAQSDSSTNQSNQQGFASVIILVILVIIFVTIGGYFYLNGYKLPNFQKDQTNSTSKINQVNPKETEGWQSYLIKYGQIRVKYPPNLLLRQYPDDNFSGIKNIELLYLKESGVTTGEPILTIQVGKRSEMDNIYSENNFAIPALGAGNNAYFEQGFTPFIRFSKDGVGYNIQLYSDIAQRAGMDPVEALSILTKMARNITFEEAESDCKSPVLKPITEFPSYFILTNRYRSDSKDPVSGWWPNINDSYPKKSMQMRSTDDGQYTSEKYANKLFAISYQKSGEVFAESTEFRSSVVEITGRPNFYTQYEKEQEPYTEILNVNCPELLKNSQVQDMYSIGHDSSDPMQVAVFGKVTNSTNLWGVKEWNVALLKKTRDEVYVKLGDKWQKYVAQDYYVAF